MILALDVVYDLLRQLAYDHNYSTNTTTCRLCRAESSFDTDTNHEPDCRYIDIRARLRNIRRRATGGTTSSGQSD